MSAVTCPQSVLCGVVKVAAALFCLFPSLVVAQVHDLHRIQGTLVRMVNPYTLVIDVDGTEQTIVATPPGGRFPTSLNVYAVCDIDALPRNAVVVFRGKVDWNNFYCIDDAGLRMYLGTAVPRGYQEGAFQSTGSDIGSFMTTSPPRADVQGTTVSVTSGSLSVRKLQENATLEVAGHVVSVKPLKVRVTRAAIIAVSATRNDQRFGPFPIAGHEFTLNTGSDARVAVELGRAVHLAGNRPSVTVTVDRTRGSVDSITIHRKEPLTANDFHPAVGKGSRKSPRPAAGNTANASK